MVSPETEGVLRWFFARPDFTKPAGRTKIVLALKAYIDVATSDRPDQGNMLGGGDQANLTGAIAKGRV